MQLALLYVKQFKKNVNYGNSRIKLQRLDVCLLCIRLQERTVKKNGPRGRCRGHRENQGTNKRTNRVTKQK